MLDDYKIESDVPVPENTSGRSSKYPWADMKIGDSFAFDKGSLQSLRNSAWSYTKRHNGVRFVFRQMGTDMWRCWKVERE